MTFEQHPELFWTLVSSLAVIGGWAGASFRSFISNLRSKNERIDTD
jgi:hypothetical protein